jgi:hypothetical protein
MQNHLAGIVAPFEWLRRGDGHRSRVSNRHPAVSQRNRTKYERDVVIDRGRISKRKKKPSKKFRDDFGHTPLSIKERIPWKCTRLVIGTGGGALPVMQEVKREAKRRKIKLVILPTKKAINELKQHPKDANAILHVTC